MLSIVIPVHNERESVVPLYQRLKRVLDERPEVYEVIFVDDGSTDGTGDLLQQLADHDPTVVVIQLRRNFGQTAALAAGFDYARGDVIVSLDGDLQHAPEDIPALLEKIEEGYDIVSGWRKDRVDNFWTRRLPSRIANWLMAKLSGVPIHDFGTTFKAYRASVLKDVRLYGELHRFIPALASYYGARITEVPIQNITRPKGRSHYGLGRTFNVLFDMLTIKFLLSYLTRPMHLFGRLGLLGSSSGALILLYLLAYKLAGHHIMQEHGPLMMAGVLLFLAGGMLFTTGLLGELVMRVYFESQGRRIYAVRRVYTRRSERLASGVPT